jgi:5-carboxymethyl-2-hydroxymuconate isomerase
MPHLTLEYSANLETQINMQALCDVLHNVILDSGLFELGAVRVRAFAAPHFAIADRDEKNAFIDMSFRIGQGRSLEEKKRAGDAIFGAASDYLKDLFATPHFALSFEIREIDPDLSWKTNSIHPRLRKTQGGES